YSNQENCVWIIKSKILDRAIYIAFDEFIVSQILINNTIIATSMRIRDQRHDV
ncbi:hypothetical protein Ciccas_013668, partial [Cichlidogyrus casuarinus]